jgi:large subunit ribosomal protein L1
LVVKKPGLSAQITLPFSAGRTKKVEVANDKTIEKLQTGKVDFDILLATADMMPKLVPFARVLGPKGLMPNPKNGTLIKSLKEAEKFSGNSVSLKTEKDKPLVHTTVGKLSQKDDELIKNTETILNGFAAQTNHQSISEIHHEPPRLNSCL